MTSLFVSYARADDESFVMRLYQDLTSQGFDVWLDVEVMPSRALTFLQEIRDAIDKTDRLLLVIGPKAVQSEYVQSEWQYALTQCKIINPILRIGNYDILPDELKLLDTQDFRDNAHYHTKFETLLRQISEPTISPAKLIAVPDLPPHFMMRSSDLRIIKQSLLADIKRPVVLTGTARRIGVQGMGGIGKSVLATALARDCEARYAFPDGIIWITVTQNPILTARQSQLAETLGDHPRAFGDIQQGKARLSDLLKDKACLLILDDVWNAEHIDAFDVLGSRCRMLVTTRDARLITAIGAIGHQLDVLDDEAALMLLAHWAGRSTTDLSLEARLVMQECGNLPLALAMIGAMVRDKPNRWDNVLHKLRNADLGLIRQQFPNYPYPDLLRAIQVSVAALVGNVQKRYLDFAVFPEDTLIPEVVLQTFWTLEGLDKYETQDVVDILVDHSLLRRDEEGRLSLHDLQFDYVRKQTHDLSMLHNRLLSSYAVYCPYGWPSGPNDGYFFDHLAHHLAAAGRIEELRSLLSQFEWLYARLTTTNINGLIADYDFLLNDKNIQLIQGALQLSSHILISDKTQLAGQLIGRLFSHQTPQIKSLLDQARHWKDTAWLCPLTPSLMRSGGPLLRTLGNHTDFVTAVAVIPDGQHAISGSADKTLRVWDLNSGEELLVLVGHTDDINAVAVISNGQRVVSASDDKTLKIWDLESGEELRTLTGHTDWVTAIAVTADGQRAVSGSVDRTLKIWDLENGGELRTIIGHNSWINAVAVTPDGQRVISASDDKTLKIWDLENGEELRTLTGHTDFVRGVAVTPDGQRIISASNDKTLKIWDLENGEELRTLTGHTDRVTAIAVIADGQRAVSASDDKTLKVWDLLRGNVLATFSGEDWLLTCSVATDGITIVTGDQSGHIHFLRLQGLLQ